jgi:hypothetical protein
MANNNKPVQHGTVGGSPINVDMARIDHGQTRRVTLSANYAMTSGPGIPSRPSMTGCATAGLDYPRTLASGTVLTLQANEAAALVAAGAASYS